MAAAMLLFLFYTMSWAAQAAEDRSPQLIDGTLNNAFEIDAANNISSTNLGEHANRGAALNDEALITGDEGAAGKTNGHQWKSGGEAPTQAQTNGEHSFPLIAGTALNTNTNATNNSAYEIDVTNNISAAIFSGQSVWGATYDAVNDRVLFTSTFFTSSGGAIGGSNLYQWKPGIITPTLVGTITIANTSNPLRIDGLAISNGILYGSRAASFDDGIYQINPTTLAATLVFSFTDSISGIDADPITGSIYGVNDSTRELVTIDVNSGKVTTVASYPDPAESDIDGLAVGIDGRAYLIPDDDSPGLIYVYNLITGSYETPLTAPWLGEDTFSGGAFVHPNLQYNVYIPAILKLSSP